MHTASAASSVNGPANTDSRHSTTRSVSGSRSKLQSIAARSVWWRGMTVRLPPVSSRNRSSSRSAICWTDSARTRAAASSMASGMPSSRRQISTTARERCRR